MAYDEQLADRIRAALPDRDDVTERKMFGGIAFMVGGNMTCGVIKEDLMARVGPDADEQALEEPHTRPMDFTNRPMKGYIYVAPEGVADDDSLQAWVDRCVDFAESLPRK
jgi:TfoX/Sxy family transcriptional regulator of competence genes